MPHDLVLVTALIIRALIVRVGVKANIIVFVHAHAADIIFFVIVEYKVCTFFTGYIHIKSLSIQIFRLHAWADENDT